MDPERGEEWDADYTVRLRAMEEAMARLDAEGLFGFGEARLRIVVNAEVMPPDFTNTNEPSDSTLLQRLKRGWRRRPSPNPN